MTTILGIILAMVIVGLFSGIIIWIVGKLDLGLEVDSFGSAFTAAIVIAIVGGIVQWLLGLVVTVPGGWFGAVINLVVAAIVLMISDNLLRGLKVAGFVGAVVAAASISVVTGLVQWLLGLVI